MFGSLGSLRHRRPPEPLQFPDGALVPEEKEHFELRTLLYDVLMRAFAAQASIGCDPFVYWNGRDPKRCLWGSALGSEVHQLLGAWGPGARVLRRRSRAGFAPTCESRGARRTGSSGGSRTSTEAETLARPPPDLAGPGEVGFNSAKEHERRSGTRAASARPWLRERVELESRP